eukprot:scaffold2523_cov366-Prasinococcus_capsulatus_cf.AAC.7
MYEGLAGATAALRTGRGLRASGPPPRLGGRAAAGPAPRPGRRSVHAHLHPFHFPPVHLSIHRTPPPNDPPTPPASANAGGRVVPFPARLIRPSVGPRWGPPSLPPSLPPGSIII